MRVGNDAASLLILENNRIDNASAAGIPIVSILGGVLTRLGYERILLDMGMVEVSFWDELWKNKRLFECALSCWARRCLQGIAEQYRNEVLVALMLPAGRTFNLLMTYKCRAYVYTRQW